MPKLAERKQRRKERKEKAQNLQAMGFPRGVAMEALEKNGDDPERAANWLMTDEGQEMIIRAQQQLHAVGGEHEGGGGDTMAWTCAVCTFVNESPDTLCCEMCQTPKAAAADDCGGARGGAVQSEEEEDEQYASGDGDDGR